MRTLVWFRGKDLRLHDHQPLCDALAQGDVVCLFVIDPHFFAKAKVQEFPHRMQFLLESLQNLAENIACRGSKLLLLPGRSVEVVPELVEKYRFDQVFAHRWTEPFARKRDQRIQAMLRVPFHLYEGETLLPPGQLQTSAGSMFSVFTPFSRAFRAAVDVGAALPAPKYLPPLPAAFDDITVPMPTLADLDLVHNARLLQGGEDHARRRMSHFLRVEADNYADARDRMDLPATSRLSQDLKFGCLSVRELWQNLYRSPVTETAKHVFSNELIWREFNHAVLWHRPEILHTSFRPSWRNFPWHEDESAWAAWVSGHTGYPIVDAASRQLLAEGFVHNRARMISASFLCKHLLCHYARGEAHYLKYLTDGDWAQNNAGWQWSAGCGCDAQPYFRVFNPVTQGKKFDPDGEYVRRWVPELAQLDARFIHAPWLATNDVLQKAGVKLGSNYPKPIVEHVWARERFLTLTRSFLKGDAAA